MRLVGNLKLHKWFAFYFYWSRDMALTDKSYSLSYRMRENSKQELLFSIEG
jgi:hypothetical protein